MDDKLIRERIDAALDNAENTWKKVEHLLEAKEETRAFNKAVELPTKIPGVPILELGKPEVGNFIAFVLDIRDSTAHLLQAISAKKAKVSLLERTFYETTAVITGGILAVEHYGGGVTELLGDGLLALFKANEKSDVYKAYNAAKKSLHINETIVNDILENRYNLPCVDIGIGLAYSRALVTILGTENNYHPKAMGECVYRASKIAKGKNEIYIDDKLNLFWPTTPEGKLEFTLLAKKFDFDAYRVKK